MKKEEQGTSMVEMIGVISFIGILAMGVWTLINSAQARFRLSRGVAQIQSLQKGIARFYASAGNYDGLKDNDAVKKLIENRIPPPGMKAGDNALRHAFGGEVEIKNVPVNDIDGNAQPSNNFTITFKGLDPSACAEMGSISWTQSDAANLVSIKIGDTKFVWPSYSESDDNILPVTLSAAMAECSNSDEEDITGTNTRDITWEFR